jgi:hypothetical protein
MGNETTFLVGGFYSMQRAKTSTSQKIELVILSEVNHLNPQVLA